MAGPRPGPARTARPLTARAEALDLLAAAPTAEELDVVKDVVGSHLERFGRRDGLAVHWN
ncbi:DUF2218 domain-containing protein [Parafrankia sp. EUN1f]|uniref:DUF2218 domain-containing protein n=1 Tax=Parafrankia sp. EUN1f TaxID=102897 RepID=UPI0001C47002|nr:DUF2218 domain-containing protein [Parafrankia sp. EUN1f]EFC82621.1 hypothetical protein FrEUN1fDRAFT_4266 [Parafrankia sp. EUN1f]